MTERAQPLILVVEDDETQRLVAVEVLRAQGFLAEGATDGEDGLQKARLLRPDVVMLDVLMPGLDGFTVCRTMRDDPDLHAIPVLIVTGREDTHSIEQGFESGAKDFMAKPINWGLLGYRIRFILRSSEMSRDLRVARDLAEAASAAKSAFLAMVTHELRTPLNAIIGFSDLMRLGVGNETLSAIYQGYVDDIHLSGTQLLSVINDVLEISRLDGGAVELREDTVDPGAMLSAALDTIRPSAAAGAVQLLSEIAGNLPMLWADPHRLRQAVARLLSNAVKFTPKDGTVRIRAELARDGRVRIAISDTGIGMSEADLARIVQPFQQADMRLGRNYGGLGLGVPLSLRIIKLHGGSLDYESVPGRGTTAIITLPAERTLRDARPGADGIEAAASSGVSSGNDSPPAREARQEV
jgi:signal transduction histidine kinase